jgi:hypothetical protein
VVGCLQTKLHGTTAEIILKEKKSISIAPLCKLNIVSYAGFYNPLL